MSVIVKEINVVARLITAAAIFLTFCCIVLEVGTSTLFGKLGTFSQVINHLHLWSIIKSFYLTLAKFIKLLELFVSSWWESFTIVAKFFFVILRPVSVALLLELEAFI